MSATADIHEEMGLAVPGTQQSLASAFSEKEDSLELNAFQNNLRFMNLNLLLARMKENLDTQFMSTLSMISNFRNESRPQRSSPTARK
jgi:hypothetical protein